MTTSGISRFSGISEGRLAGGEGETRSSGAPLSWSRRPPAEEGVFNGGNI